ncbi:MAG: ABC transporter permease [Pseudomonadota bacterium]
MTSLIAVFKREFRSYFYSTTAFVYVTLFLFAVSVFTFYIGDLTGRNQADLTPFFAFHPYIFLMFMPALSMRLWAEERKTGTLELLLTLPISDRALVLGKFLASWAFATLALIGTFPIWFTISFLGNPDQGLILSSYFASFFMAGGFLAIGGYISARSSNQIIAFILSAVISFLFLMTGFPLITEPLMPLLSPYMLDLIIHFSALIHFENFIKGAFSVSGLIYFCAMILFWLCMTEIHIQNLRMGR